MPTDRFRDPAGEWAYRMFPAVIVFASFSISLFEIAAGIFMALCVWSYGARRPESKLPRFLPWLALAYFTAVVLSLTQTEYLSTSLRGVSKVARGLLLCLSAAYILDEEERLKKTALWFAAAAAFVSIDALLQAATGYELLGREMTPYHGDTRRVTGPFKHANDLSAFLAPLFLLTAGCAASARKALSKKSAFLLIGALPVQALALLWTYSRAGWLAASAGAVVWAFLRRSKPAIALVALAALWAFFLSPPLVRLRLHSIADPRGSVAERRELWGGSLRMIETSPVFGLGSNTYAKNEPLYKPADSKLDSQYAHNGYLQIGAETGLLGLGSFLTLIFVIWFSAVRRFSRAPASAVSAVGTSFAVALVAVWVHGFLDTNLHSVLLVGNMWILLGALAAAGRVAERV